MLKELRNIKTGTFTNNQDTGEEIWVRRGFLLFIASYM